MVRVAKSMDLCTNPVLIHASHSHSHIVSRRGGEYSAEESWNGWIKCQDLFNGSAQNVEAGETVEGPEEGAGLSGDAVSRPISETDLVFAKTKKRTFFPAFKAPGTGHVDRVKV